VRTILNCAVALLDDTIVPFHVPAMLVAVPADTADGAVELPPHAATLTMKQSIQATRIVSSKFCVRDNRSGMLRHAFAASTQAERGAADGKDRTRDLGSRHPHAVAINSVSPLTVL